MAVNQYSEDYHTFTPKEDTYIREHFTVLTNKEMAAAIGTSKDAVQRRTKYLGLGTKKRRGTIDWKANNGEKEDFLRRHFRDPDWTAERIGQHLGCAKTAVYTKAEELGLTNPMHYFTDKDDRLILALYHCKPLEDLAEQIGISRYALMRRASALGIVGKLNTIQYSSDQDDLILNLREDGVPLDAIADIMGRSKESVKMRLKRVRKALRDAAAT